MNRKSISLVGVIALVLVVGLWSANAAESDSKEKKKKNQPRHSNPSGHPGGVRPDSELTNPPGAPGRSPGSFNKPRESDNQPHPPEGPQPGRKEGKEAHIDGAQSRSAPEKSPGATSPSVPRPPLVTRTTSTGYEKTARSGKVRERMVTKPGGEQRIQQFSATGRVEKEVVTTPDKRIQTTSYDLGHREKRVEVVNANKTREVTDVHYNRQGQVQARETIKTDTSGAPISKTVVVNRNVIVHNTVVNKTVVNVHNTTVVREYRPARYGFVYTPVLIAPVVYAGWYDPFWYAPPVVVGGPVVAIHTHHFTFAWGWEADPWYIYHRAYWEPYPVYVAPSYWVTDWMVGSYLADRYAVATSVDQTREEVRLAREDAEKARVAAEQAGDAAEIAEARAAQAAAEARAERAEARAARAEAAETSRKEMAASGKPNPNATPIDKETKEALNHQIEQTIAEKKAFADQTAKGENPLPPDVSHALADPGHIYPVSKSISVISTDDKPAGTLTAGDLLKAEPGQLAGLKDAKETDFVMMRVMTSKGEEDEVPAGTVVKISLKDLQDFDNEFRAKLDEGLKEASAHSEEFKQMAQK